MSALTTNIEPSVDRISIARFAMLNVLGGSAVLGSYVWGVTAPGIGNALWGGVPESLRPLYTINMFLAAGGYFLFTTVVVRRLLRGHDGVERAAFARRMERGYALILVGSALWLPLTAAMLQSPDSLLWVLVRIDLALVGLGVLLLWELVLSPGAGPRWERLVALVGLLPFTLQTVVLDALIWPYFFVSAGTTGGITS